MCLFAPVGLPTPISESISLPVSWCSSVPVSMSECGILDACIACVHVYLCASGVGELNRLYLLCSGCFHRSVWIYGSSWQRDDHFCRLLWPIGPSLVWSPLILFLSFSSPPRLPAQSVEGTLELSRDVVSGIWVLLRGSSTPSSLLPASPKR